MKTRFSQNLRRNETIFVRQAACRKHDEPQFALKEETITRLLLDRKNYRPPPVLTDLTDVAHVRSRVATSFAPSAGDPKQYNCIQKATATSNKASNR